MLELGSGAGVQGARHEDGRDYPAKQTRRPEPIMEPEPRDERPTGKPEAKSWTNPKATISPIAAKRAAAYEALDLFLDSLDGPRRAEEIEAMRVWLENY